MNVAESYDNAYQAQNYFAHREWMCRPYISSLLNLAGLPLGSSILDVGCGQGFFSYLLQTSGMRVHGLDLSETGVTAAHQLYGHLGIKFVVADAMHIPFSQRFDCVFTRSLSLYNSDRFPFDSSVTDALFPSVTPGGCLIFLYNTKLGNSKVNSSWRYHSLADAQNHFAAYPSFKLFFVTKIDTVVWGKRAFSARFTDVNSFISRRFGVGGDLVCLIRKQ